MRRLPPLLVCVLAASAFPQAPAPPALSGHLSAWTQDCDGDCSPPRADGRGGPVSLVIAVPTKPGEASTAGFDRELSLPDAGAVLRAKVSFYSVCPRGAQGGPGGDPCPSRYLQVQVVLSGDARAFCGASLDWADAYPFPVVMCAGEDSRRPGRRLGVTLSREAPAL